MGLTLEPGGVNVAVWAPDADSVDLCVFDATGETRIEVPYRDGGVWHAHVDGIEPGTQYGLRVAGPHHPERGLRFNHNKLLIDPYAKALTGQVRWNPLMRGHAVGPGDDMSVDTRDSAPVVPKAIVLDTPTGPDPKDNRPWHRWVDTVIYEAHVKGLTMLNPHIPPEQRGTYLGLAHPWMVDHLHKLGVTALELLPIQAFADDEFLVRKNRRNYWGYQPIAWQAPEPRYAHLNANEEVRTLVHTLHEAGIEVILDIVFNHTCEGDGLGPTLSYKGLNNTGYYRLINHGRHYVNDTGTGNTFAIENDMVLRLVLDSMRHWVNRYGVDGFRFDLAATLGRVNERFSPDAAFFQAVRQDPVLTGVKLIAEPWDVGPDGYQLGRFPYPWKEWNDTFRDSVRDAWRGQALGYADVGSRLTGSANIFDHSWRSASASVNFLTAHDGFTLRDVVSYSHKHNEPNGEKNHDGHDENFSDNMGAEGPTDDPGINAARARRVRGLLATLFVSQGVPMLLAGDELGNTQNGNNNAYTQDNHTGWIDWEDPDTDLIEFVSQLTAVRRRLPLLRQRNFLHGRTRQDGTPDIQWFTAAGNPPEDSDWHDPALKTICAEIRGAAGFRAGEDLTGCVYLIVNTGAEVVVTLPSPPTGVRWQLQLDSANPDVTRGDDAVYVEGNYHVPEQSVIVLSHE